MSKLIVGLITFICFLVAISQAKHGSKSKKCSSHFVVTQVNNDIVPVAFGDSLSAIPVPTIVSWYIASYLNGEIPSNCTDQPPAISSASCVLEAISLIDDNFDDKFDNNNLDDEFPVAFNCDGTILINQLPNGMKDEHDECYGIITWQGPIGSLTASTVAITGGSGDYEGVTGQMVVTNVQDSTQCPCGDGIHMSPLPACFKYELFLDDVEGTGKTTKEQMNVMSKLGISIASIGLALGIGFGIYKYKKNNDNYEKTAAEEHEHHSLSGPVKPSKLNSSA